MKRWLKRSGWGLGLLVILAVGTVAVEHFRGQRALDQRVRGLRSQGEQLSVAALEPKRPSADQNAALDLIALTNRLEAIKTNLDNAPPPLRFAAPGRAVVAWRLKEWSYDRKTTNDWTKLRPGLEQAHELLPRVHSAMQKPGFDGGFDYRKGFVDFQLPSATMVAHRTAQLLTLATLSELHQGRVDAAQTHLRDLVKLAASQKPEPLILTQLIRQGCTWLALNATWQALQAPGWDEAQLASLQAAWEGFDLVTDLAAAFEMERAMTLGMFQQMRASKEKLALVVARNEQAREVTGGVFPSFVTHGFVLNWIHLPLWRAAWADQDELNALNRWQRIIERQRVVRSHAWTALASRPGGEQAKNPRSVLARSQEPEDLNRFDRVRFLFSSDEFSVTDSTIRKTLFAQAQQQMTITALALQRYQLRTGKLPADLDVLLPDYLPALPRDSMDGKPLRYRLVPDGGFVLYSVGEDGKDDGGNPAPRSGNEKYSRIWDGLDGVWPIPASDEEAASAPP